MTLEDAANKVRIPDTTAATLRPTTRNSSGDSPTPPMGCVGKRTRKRHDAELEATGREAQTAGTQLNKLLTD